jgi:hypothetical protein
VHHASSLPLVGVLLVDENDFLPRPLPSIDWHIKSLVGATVHIDSAARTRFTSACVLVLVVAMNGDKSTVLLTAGVQAIDRDALLELCIHELCMLGSAHLRLIGLIPYEVVRCLRFVI